MVALVKGGVTIAARKRNIHFSSNAIFLLIIIISFIIITNILHPAYLQEALSSPLIRYYETTETLLVQNDDASSSSSSSHSNVTLEETAADYYFSLDDNNNNNNTSDKKGMGQSIMKEEENPHGENYSSVTAAPPFNIPTLARIENHNTSMSRSDRRQVNLIQKEQRKPMEYYIGRDEKGREVLLRNDLSSLVDIAYIGHSKCASSSIQNWFRNHEDIYISKWEDKVMQSGPLNAVKFVYKKYPDNNNNNGKLIAYKHPADINHRVSLPTIQNFFPRTKLVIGIRHPVLWFQSFYNFWEGMASRNSKIKHLPSNTSELIGPCLPNVTNHVCTDHARFHLQIAKVLGNRGGSGISTNSNDGNTTSHHHSTVTMTYSANREMHLLGVTANVISSIRAQRVYNPVFIYDVSQLMDSNRTRKDSFREDFRQFLGVRSAFSEQPPRKNRGKKSKTKIDICDDSNGNVRAVLMEHSRNIAAWIREFLLYSNDKNLVVSSKEYFEGLIETYNHDPCDLNTFK